jgi:hypothetical protein
MIRLVRWVGLAVVLAAAAILSFDALRSLAIAVSIPTDLAWLLPIAVDAGAAVSCACWLSRDVPADAARFAQIQTWLLLGGTVVGNAGQLGMHAHGITPPWWVAVLVGAIPPAVVGGTVHLVVLLGRPDATQSTEEESNPMPEIEPAVEPAVERPALRSVPAKVATPTVRAPVAETDPEGKARELAAAGVGRPTIIRETGLKDHVVKTILAEAKANA